MHRLRDTWKIITDSFKDILDFWPIPFLWAVGSTVLVVTAGLGVDFMFNLFTYLYDRFWLGQNVTLGDYYPSNYLFGVLIVLIPVFLYLLLHESAKKYKEKRKEAELYTVKGIDVIGVNTDRTMPAGIRVTNKKGVTERCNHLCNSKSAIRLVTLLMLKSAMT